MKYLSRLTSAGYSTGNSTRGTLGTAAVVGLTAAAAGATTLALTGPAIGAAGGIAEAIGADTVTAGGYATLAAGIAALWGLLFTATRQVPPPPPPVVNITVNIGMGDELRGRNVAPNTGPAEIQAIPVDEGPPTISISMAELEASIREPEGDPTDDVAAPAQIPPGRFYEMAGRIFEVMLWR